jgi:EmrB/QacA subfamily drug resistance transporter
MLSPVAFSTLWRAFPPEERSKAAGIMVIPAAAAPASGPVVGGLLLKYASWEWIFLVNVPIGIAALVISALYLREHKEPAPGRFDPPGFVLSASGLASVLYGLSQVGDRGFGDARVLGFLLGGLALMTAFALVELRTKEPMLDVRILKNGLFRACNLSWIVTNFSFSAMIFLLTLELQTTRGFSALQSGLTTFPMAIGVMMMAQPASRLYRTVGPRRLILTGLLVTALTTAALVRVDLQTSAWNIRALMLVRGLAFGLILVPLQAATYATISPALTGRATALYNATSQMGSSLGVAVVAAVLTSRLSAHDAVLGSPVTRDASLSAFQDGFLVMAVIAFAASAVALLISDRAAAPTMAPHDVAVAIDGDAETAGSIGG